MEKTDEALIADYLAGDEGAFAPLVERHLKRVYSFAARSVADEAEDIAQETFLKAWKNLERYDPKSARFATWLMRIARNTVIDHARKKRPFVFSDFADDRGESFLEDAPDREPLPDELAARAHDARVVEEALERISPPHREVLLLRYLSQLSFDEIGGVLNASPNTARSRHRRALAELRRALETLHQKTA